MDVVAHGAPPINGRGPVLLVDVDHLPISLELFLREVLHQNPSLVDWIMVQVSTNSACHFNTVLKQGSRPARKLALLELPHMSLDTHPPAQRLSRYFTRTQESGGAGGMWPCRLLLAQMRCDVNFLHELRPNLTSKFKLEAVVHVPQKAG